MNAKKCDRCGKFYDYYNGNKNKESANAIKFVENARDGVYGCSLYDLCPECMSKLQEWLMKGMKTNGYRINV